ncbi:MAG: RNA polymerase factor sigma-54 [Gammaproteobacteria bacterium]|nr:RNA polymerase factor sigma-54 [Gammaproteobacteria bacterium]|tara:strand:- start:625 stop:2052 length:1428 start_codon:yes stop_codon:yes gene_type:complete
MKQALQLKVGQSLTMTPQLQQAIKLLQMSSLDLQQEITRALEENPLLEREEEIEQASEPSENSITEQETPVDSIEIAIETDWSDTNHFDLNRPMTRVASDDEYDSYENRASENLTLADHLLWQLNLMPLTERDMLIARVLVDSINSDGFLDANLEEITTALAQELEDLEFDEVECVLHQIQRLDPVGIGARGIAESLTVQLAALGLTGGDVSLPLALVQNHLELLTKKDRAGLKRALNCTDEKLDIALELIRSLDPKPGSNIGSNNPEYVTPDLIVRRSTEGWIVELNPDALPRVAINQTYQNFIKSGDKSETNDYLKGQLQEARWFVKSLKSRAETLLKVGTCIVEEQIEFFEKGPVAMKPMVLADIANRVEMHESTISRVTTQKYMHTPRGTLELKYFFSSHVGTDGGGEASSTAIKEHIKELISDENPKKPLSDNKLSKMLSGRGFKVARRTIAKYREMLGISGSSERKQLF